MLTLLTNLWMKSSFWPNLHVLFFESKYACLANYRFGNGADCLTAVIKHMYKDKALLL